MKTYKPVLDDASFLCRDTMEEYREWCENNRGKDFVQLKNGPFDLDLIFAPDGIESFMDSAISEVNRIE